MNLQPGDILVYVAKFGHTPWCLVDVIQSVNVHDGYVIIGENNFMRIKTLELELEGSWRYRYDVARIPVGKQLNTYLQDLHELLC